MGRPIGLYTRTKKGCKGGKNVAKIKRKKEKSFNLFNNVVRSSDYIAQGIS
jgi:hypothetical protein